SYVIQSLPCNGNGFTAQVLVTWTATDASGNSSTCQDIIYLKKPAIGQIVFPPDVSVSCTNPDIDPSVTGSPSYNGLPIDYACQYTVWYNDVTIPMCPGAHKIKRTWTVMDWCTSAMRTDVQEILIIDDNAPTITCPPSITISTNNNVCTAKYTLPVVQVSDLCADPHDIVVRFHVAGIPGIFSSGQMVTLGVGITVITVSATDPCGNSSICQYNVTVRDNVPPIPICHNLVISLGPDGMAFIYANLLDFPITENCGILSKQVFRMTNNCGVPEDLQPGPDVKFCCADVGTNVMVGFKVTDVSGNMNTCMFQVTVKDQIPPIAHCKDITISVQGGGTIVVDPGQINNGSTDNCSIVDLDLTPNTFTCEDAGVNVVVLTVTDQSGNTSTCSATVTIVDNIPPNAICHDITVTIGGNGMVTITADDIDDGSTDNCGIDTMWLNQYTFTCDDEGPNLVTLTVEDFAGNTDACTATVTVLTSPPVALCKDATVSLGADGTVTINGNTVNNGSFDDCGQVTLMVTPNTFDCTDLGPNLVTLTVTDNSGNTSTCTAIVTVVDNLPPIALCHDITIMLDDNGNATITAAQIDNGSSDNCGPITLTVTPNTFTCEDVGNNVVTLTVTDEAGNTSTCTANVMVAMPDPPNAICQNADVTLNQNGTITIDPQIVNNGSNTQCGDLTFSVTPNTFDCGDLGPNIVVLTVTDEAGSTSTCTAIVTVHENPPVAHCKNITVSLGPNGMVTITASQVNNGSTDDCPPFTLTVTPSTFNCTNLGPNVVTLTVTDGSGNTSTCTSTVTVQDITPPIPHCHDITVTLNSNGMVTITGAQVDNGSTDNCTIVSRTVTPNTFDCQDVGPNLVVLTVTDQSGNSSTCSAIVTVNPPPPMATCQNITVSIGPNGTVTIQPSDVGNGGDPCDNLTLTLDEDTFDCFELGANIVTLTVTDGFGNTSTCTSTVTVVDNTPPNCNTHNITVSLDGTGHATINANQINNNSTDNCMISMISVTPTSFDCTDLGPNIVTLTVTDQSGNSSTCTATVTVVDNIPPVALCHDITVTLGGNG
ncbi:MAG TPA: hypothetical protein VJ508_13350, partial [Saprospiraceae bacterium]|nr:hypothetical protein [Saprospiraceae bacterium]